MTYCTTCGRDLVRNERFCPSCGAGNARFVAQSSSTASNSKRGRGFPWPWFLVGVGVFIACGFLASLAELDEVDDEPTREVAAARPTVTRTPTPTVDEIRTIHPPMADVRDLWVRTESLEGERLSFEGEVMTIRVAPEGHGFELGAEDGGFLGFGDDDGELYRTYLQVWVEGPTGNGDSVFVGYDIDLTGVYEGDTVHVYGRVVGYQMGENAFGGNVTAPLVDAILVEQTNNA